MYIKPEREEVANFVPYLQSGSAVLVTRDNPEGITGFDDSLCGTKVIAITGATGFVGARLLKLAVDEGHEVVALTRRSQNERHGVTWVQGALDNRQALHRLVDGAEAVIHVAGVITARDAAGFEAGNVTACQRQHVLHRRGMHATDRALIRRHVSVWQADAGVRNTF